VVSASTQTTTDRTSPGTAVDYGTLSTAVGLAVWLLNFILSKIAIPAGILVYLLVGTVNTNRAGIMGVYTVRCTA